MATKRTQQTTIRELVDTTTGECLQYETSKTFTKHIKSEGFYMTFIDYISPLYNLKTDTAKSILSWMCVHAEFNTGIVKLTTLDRKEICNLLSISSNTLTNNITLLKKHKLITGEKGTFYINSEIFWKGDMQTRDKVINSEEFKITFAIN